MGIPSDPCHHEVLSVLRLQSRDLLVKTLCPFLLCRTRTGWLHVGLVCFNQQTTSEGKGCVNFICEHVLKSLSGLDLYFSTLAVGFSPDQ